VFVETDLLNAAGPRVFDRALDYARYVAGLQVGEEDAFAAVLGDVRDRYKRRTSLLAALDRAGLRTVPETPGA
jgi:hypothetical protein